eukprot:GHRR01037647.1.p1 GENE.GHRR01037647.1~~GHRR01037647.1.p1  ORF type:complete len:109 (-),score=11.50 GHRR01037647.1:146-472(-)
MIMRVALPGIRCMHVVNLVPRRLPNAAGSAMAAGKGLDNHPMYPCAKLKLDQLFLQWLSLPDSQTLVSSLVEDAKQGKALKGPSSSLFSTPLSPTTSHAIFAATVSQK